MKRPVRVWHVALAITVVYAFGFTVIETIWAIDPWLFAAIAFGGVLAL